MRATPLPAGAAIGQAAPRPAASGADHATSQLFVAKLEAAAQPAVAAPALAAAAPEAGLTVTDMLGRVVTLPRPPRRIVLLDARDIVTMALLHPDPAGLVAGWAGAELLDSEVLRQGYAARPGGGAIPVVGGATPDSRSLESILALAPDLVVATAQAEPALAGGSLPRQLAAAGIPTLFSSADANTPGAAG
ncbi:ferrichrome/ferrioxamine B periplasmic transporter, partial [Pseudoroseomonas cervicalis ATCC 49957]